MKIKKRKISIPSTIKNIKHIKRLASTTLRRPPIGFRKGKKMVIKLSEI